MAFRITHGMSPAINDFLAALERQAQRRIDVGRIDAATGLAEAESKRRLAASRGPLSFSVRREETPEEEHQRDLELIEARGKAYGEQRKEISAETTRRALDRWVQNKFNYATYEQFKEDAEALGLPETEFANELQTQNLRSMALEEQYEAIREGASAHSPEQVTRLETLVAERQDFLANAQQMSTDPSETRRVLNEIDQEIEGILTRPDRMTKPKTPLDDFKQNVLPSSVTRQIPGFESFVNGAWVKDPRSGRWNWELPDAVSGKKGMTTEDIVKGYQKIAASAELENPVSPYFGMGIVEYTERAHKEQWAAEVAQKVGNYQRRMVEGEQLNPAEQQDFIRSKEILDGLKKELGQTNGGNGNGATDPKKDAIPMPEDASPKTLKDGQVYRAMDARTGQPIYFKYHAATNTVEAIP